MIIWNCGCGCADVTYVNFHHLVIWTWTSSFFSPPVTQSEWRKRHKTKTITKTILENIMSTYLDPMELNCVLCAHSEYNRKNPVWVFKEIFCIEGQQNDGTNKIKKGKVSQQFHSKHFIYIVQPMNVKLIVWMLTMKSMMLKHMAFSSWFFNGGKKNHWVHCMWVNFVGIGRTTNVIKRVRKKSFSLFVCVMYVCCRMCLLE